MLENHAYYSDSHKVDINPSINRLLEYNLDQKILKSQIRLSKYKYGTLQDNSHLNQLLDPIIKGIIIFFTKFYCRINCI
jgi:hypothetical protein